MRIFHTDMGSFTGAGYGSVRIPAGIQLELGEDVFLTDDEADAVEAIVLSVAGNTAQVRIRWDRSPIPTFDLELSPMARRTGVTYLHDVYLDADEQVAPGDSVLVRDEGGRLWVAEVGPREEVRLGYRYSLRLRPTS